MKYCIAFTFVLLFVVLTCAALYEPITGTALMEQATARVKAQTSICANGVPVAMQGIPLALLQVRIPHCYWTCCQAGGGSQGSCYNCNGQLVPPCVGSGGPQWTCCPWY